LSKNNENHLISFFYCSPSIVCQANPNNWNWSPPAGIRRHAASPSRLHLRFLAALWFAPARLRLDYPSPGGDRLPISASGKHHFSRAQQAFTCCADLNGASALCFGWPEGILYCSASFLKSILLSSKAQIQIQDKDGASSDLYQVNRRRRRHIGLIGFGCL